MVKKKDYNADSIVTLDGLDGIIERPAMYIGDIGPAGTFHLYNEAIDNSIDEGSEGYADTISVSIDTNGSVIQIQDNGRGIPVVSTSYKPEIGKEVPVKDNKLEEIVTNLHSGGKFSKDAYKYSGGMYGVGTKVVNALSEFMKFTVHREGYQWEQVFSRGKALSKLKCIKASKLTGTTIQFKPDIKVLKDTTLNPQQFRDDVERRAYLNKGLKFKLEITDNKQKEKLEFKFDNGIKDMVSKLNDKPLFKDVLYFEKFDEETEMFAELALGYSKDYENQTMSFANGIFMKQDGKHVEGAYAALSSSILKYIKANNLIPKKDSVVVTSDDVREGLVLVLSVKIKHIILQGQTKDKLGNLEAKTVVQKMLNEYLYEYLAINKDKALLIAKKAIAAAKGRQAAKSARKRAQKEDSALASFATVGKLTDCKEDTPASDAEIFLIEGDSAGGTVRLARNPVTQAVFPFRGKSRNTHDDKISDVVNKGGSSFNKEFSDLVKSLKTGYGTNTNLDNLRYKSGIYILTDADKDGQHIESLMLTFFYKHYRELIEKGYLYIALPPLYSVKEGKKTIYFLNDDEYNDYLIKRITDNNTIEVEVNKEKKELKGKQALTFSKILVKYNEVLNQVSAKYGDTQLIEKLMITYMQYKYFSNVSTENLTKAAANLSKTYNLNITVNSNNDLEIEGFYNNTYHAIILDDLFVSDVQLLEETIKPLKGMRFFYANGTKSMFSAMQKMIDSSRPKHRQRYKGLGEMDYKALSETTLDPNTRSVIQIKIDNFEEADKVTYNLMGKDPETRKAFLDQNVGTDFEVLV